ncbi:hypothetical protein JCM10207_001007 [Rhodosporidiobolus poonsookiae]
MGFGDYFAAQQSEYCLTTDEKCCGICQNVPITGFGTFCSNVLATLFNLLLTYHWHSETSYTLGLQIIGTDAMVFSLVDRIFEPKNRLTLFHYIWVPLAAMSVMPMIVVTALSPVHYVHNVTSVEYERLDPKDRFPLNPSVKRRRTAQGEESSEGHRRPPLPPPNKSDPGPAREMEENAVGKGLFGRRKSKKGEEHEMRPYGSRKSSRFDPKAPSYGHKHVRYDSGEVVAQYTKVNGWLPQALKWILLIHLIVWTAVFSIVFFGIGAWTNAQDNCVDEYGLKTWRIAIGICVYFFLVISALFTMVLWIMLGKVKKAADRAAKGKGKADGTAEDDEKAYDGLYLVLSHVPKALGGDKLLDRVLRNRKAYSRFQWGISMFFYIVWCIPYITMYFLALQKFLMLGSNAWPYEQINAAFSILTPLCIVARAFFQEHDGWRDKHDAREEAYQAAVAALAEERSPTSSKSPTPTPSRHSSKANKTGKKPPPPVPLKHQPSTSSTYNLFKHDPDFARDALAYTYYNDATPDRSSRRNSKKSQREGTSPERKRTWRRSLYRSKSSGSSSSAGKGPSGA